MYLSHLMINVGDNPDRERPGRKWLRNVYHVHQRLCMAFPSKERQDNDKMFLKPFSPDDFAQGHVHVPRNADAGFLFRIDPELGGSVSILVLSALKPDWDYAFQNAGFLLAAPPSEPRSFLLNMEKGSVLRFQLVANPTKRLRRDSCYANGEKIDEKWVGRRVPVPLDRMEEWLARKAEANGFRISEVAHLQAGYVYFDRKPEKGTGQKLRSVRYEGILKVTDAEKLHKAMISGIGPAKAFGFGLLSLASV